MLLICQAILFLLHSRGEEEERLLQIRTQVKSLLTTEQQHSEAEKHALVEQLRKEMDETLSKEKILLEEKKVEAIRELRQKFKKETEEVRFCF